MKTRTLTFDQAAAILAYDPQTGTLTWLPRAWVGRSWNTKFAGKPAGGKTVHDGYRRVMIGGTLHLSHRLAWLLHHGEWPPADIDHANGDRSDNRLSNLRAACRSDNCANKGTNRNNQVGAKGVSRITNGKYRSVIHHLGRKHHLGYFDTTEEATAAYREAAARIYREYARI